MGSNPTLSANSSSASLLEVPNQRVFASQIADFSHILVLILWVDSRAGLIFTAEW